MSKGANVMEPGEITVEQAVQALHLELVALQAPGSPALIAGGLVDAERLADWASLHLGALHAHVRQAKQRRAPLSRGARPV